MSARTFGQAGIGHIATVLALAFVAVVGFAGYTVVSKNASQQDSAVQQSATGAPDKITSKADLEKTDKALTESDAQLDSGLNDRSLDADIDSML